MRRFAALLAALLALAGCTGTQEGVETVLLVVVTEDEVGLVHHARDADASLVPLPAAADPLPAGAAPVGVSVARYAGPDQNDVRVEVVYRLDDEDLLRTYDATFVPPDEAERFAPLGSPTNLSELVAASGELTEGLCTTAFDVSPNGRWLALVHDPTACPEPGAERALIVVDREEDEVLPPISRDVASARFASSNDALFFVDEFADEIVRVGLPAGEDDPIAADGPFDADELVDLRVDPTGRLVLASDDVVGLVDPAGDDEAAVAQESATGLVALLEAELPAGPAVTARTATRIVTHPDPLADLDGDDAYCTSTNAGAIVDATVGPFAFAYALRDGGLAVHDLYACEPGVTGSSTLPARPTLSSEVLADAVAIDWIFGAAPEAPVAP